MAVLTQRSHRLHLFDDVASHHEALLWAQHAGKYQLYDLGIGLLPPKSLYTNSLTNPVILHPTHGLENGAS